MPLSRRSTASCGEVAWALVELCRIGQAVQTAGWCVGPLAAGDLRWVGRKIRRAVKPRVFQRIRHRFAARAHVAHGHDRGCLVLGVPLATLERFVRAWATPQAALLILDCVDEALAELATGGWSDLRIDEILAHVVGRRITLRAPANETCYMPRFASKLPSSRRAFT
jgi:hypothetical protein